MLIKVGTVHVPCHNIWNLGMHRGKKDACSLKARAGEKKTHALHDSIFYLNISQLLYADM